MQGADALVVEEADPERLRQALENRVGNALIHTPPDVPVVVEVARQTCEEGERAVLHVRDEGPGIAPSLLPTLFTRFTHGGRSPGLGLGLYLVRGIAEAHGGTLTWTPRWAQAQRSTSRCPCIPRQKLCERPRARAR